MTTTPERVAAQVATILKRRPEARVFGIHTTGPWSGSDSVLVDGSRMPVAYCRSPLEISAQLSSLPEDDSLILLTPLTDRALGLDVLARLPGRRLTHLDPWELVRQAFGATHIDPRLPTQGWVAESLLGALPGGGFAPVPSGCLDADTAWRTLLQYYLKLDTGRPDGVDLIHWSLDLERVSRYRALPESFRSGIRERLAETAGALGGILADAMESGQGTELLSIGLVCEVLFVAEGRQSPALSQAVARLEPLVAGRTLNDDQGQAWFEAARNVFDRLDGGRRRASIERAQNLLEALKAMPFADRSTVFSAGFQQRLAAFGRALNAYLDGKTDPAEVEAALDRVRSHGDREDNPERIARLEMAQRLVRRLGHGSAQAKPSFGKAIEAFITDGVFVDWARRYLLGGDAIAELGTAFGRLYRRIRELREPENRRFAERLQEWNRAPKPERGFLPIEAFLDKVVAKVAAQAPVLVVVIDGMDGGVFEELAEDLQQRGWSRWADPGSTAGEALLCVLPSVTEFSRTALLTGRVQPGSSATEKAGFAADANLCAVSHLSRPPVLYHKGELTDTAAEGLSPSVRETLACPEQRIVGIVLNAVDDHLAKSEQLRLKWTVDSFRILDALLYEARVAGRAVVITADHGHVLEEDGIRLPGDTEERWRAYGEPLAEQEMVFEGPRIRAAIGKRQVTLLWSESARYCQKRNGYHGGASPQEAVVPLGVFLCVGQALEGWQPVAEHTPEWWWSPAPTPVAEPLLLKKGRKRPPPPPTGQAHLFETLETACATAAPDWIRSLFESDVYRAQSRLAGRLAPPEKTVREMLSTLESRHRRAPRRVIAQAIGVPEFRLRGILAGMQRVLNVEGYQVLAVEESHRGSLGRCRVVAETIPDRRPTVISISPQRRDELLDALRRGTVPSSSLDLLAVGLEGFQPALVSDLEAVRSGRGVLKAVRGEYGSGKTFFARWLEEIARQAGFASSEVQVSETETPLHRLETVYRRLVENLSTIDTRLGALRSIIDGWFYTLEEEVLQNGEITAPDQAHLLERTNTLMERRLEQVTRQAPTFAACLRGHRSALAEEDQEVAEGLLAWLSGSPNVAARIKHKAGIKGDIDHFGALGFLRGLLTVLRDSGHPGLVLVLDEVETLQRVRGDVRDKGLNALRQFMDEIEAGRFPGLYLLMTGTPAFFDGAYGVQRLPPLAQRLHVDFRTDPRFDNPRAVQIRLPGFDSEKLWAVGVKVRDTYASHCPNGERVRRLADDAYLCDLARAVTGELGGKVGIAPRVFLKKLVAEVLDRIDQFSDFDPRRHYALTVSDTELTDVERNARGQKDKRVSSVDEIELDL